MMSHSKFEYLEEERESVTMSVLEREVGKDAVEDEEKDGVADGELSDNDVGDQLRKQSDGTGSPVEVPPPPAPPVSQIGTASSYLSKSLTKKTLPQR